MKRQSDRKKRRRDTGSGGGGCERRRVKMKHPVQVSEGKTIKKKKRNGRQGMPLLTVCVIKRERRRKSQAAEDLERE